MDPLALIEEGMPVVVLAPRDSYYKKNYFKYAGGYSKRCEGVINYLIKVKMK
jgi:glucosamine 6-phosphate synthetase-like amidotransferase/phosphosugar isomerase protein